jgi:hypothetical protein
MVAVDARMSCARRTSIARHSNQGGYIMIDMFNALRTHDLFGFGLPTTSWRGFPSIGFAGGLLHSPVTAGVLGGAAPFVSPIASPLAAAPFVSPIASQLAAAPFVSPIAQQLAASVSTGLSHTPWTSLYGIPATVPQHLANVGMFAPTVWHNRFAPIFY